MSRAAKTAMTKARTFPDNTCPASRHAQLLAETLMSNKPTWYVTDDRQHSGESIAATVTALWKARTEVERLKDALRHVRMTMGPTDPPCCAGCRHEWAEVLRTVDKALGPNVELSGARDQVAEASGCRCASAPTQG